MQGPELATFIDECIADLMSPDTEERLEAAACLGRLRRKARPAVPALVLRLKDPEVIVRKMAILALGDIGAPDAIPALRDALHDANESVRRRAAIALEELGVPPPQAA
jgi:HEAT repeat protein